MGAAVVSYGELLEPEFSATFHVDKNTKKASRGFHGWRYAVIFLLYFLYVISF